MESEYINLVEPEISGGKISIERIDTLSDMGGDKLRISGLRQDTFEYLIDKFGGRFSRIEFWKCGNVESLSPLEDLDSVKEIFWFWNKRSTSLWDLSKNKKLSFLHLKSFNKVKNIDELSKSDVLKDLTIEDGMWGRGLVESFEPLTKIPTLEILELSPEVKDGRLEPITRIKNLKEFYYPANRFTTDKYAWLAARLGASVKSNVTHPTRDLEHASYTNSKGEHLDTLVTGRRKPILDSKKHKKRLEKYLSEWERLVEYYAANPNLGEPQ